MCWFVDSICIMALLLTEDVMNNPWKAKAAKKVELPSAFFLFLQFFYFILSSSFSSSSSYSYSEKDMKSCAEISISSLVRRGPQRPPEFKTRSLNWLIHSFLYSIPPSSPTYYFTTTKQWRRFWGLVNQPDFIQLINSLTWAELHRMMTWTSADRWPFQLNAMNRRTGADEFNAGANCKWDEVALSFDWLIVIIQVICSIE